MYFTIFRRIKALNMKAPKMVLIIASLLIAITSGISQDYFMTNLHNAKLKAVEENKRIFVDFTAKWCKPCKMMENDVFPDPRVKKLLKENFISVKLDEKDNRGLMKQYNVSRIPLFLILEKDGQEVFRWGGYSATENFLKMFENIPTRSLEKEKYDSLFVHRKDDIDFLYDYNTVLIKNNYSAEAEKVAGKILKKSDNWIEKRNMELILNHVGVKKYKNFLIKNKQSFINTFGEDTINNAFFTDYLNSNYVDDIASLKPDIDNIKSDFKELFGDKYVYYLDNYLMLILENKDDLRNVYIFSFVHYLKQPKKLFISQQLYSKLVTLIFKLKTTAELNELYQAFMHQFQYDEIDLIYYDLKALLEYKLNMENEAVKTIQNVYRISFEKFGVPYKSNFDSLRKLDQLISK